MRSLGTSTRSQAHLRSDGAPGRCLQLSSVHLAMNCSQCGNVSAAITRLCNHCGAAGSRPWIKWAVIAVLLFAVGAGVLLAQKLGRFSHSANMASPAPSGPAGTASTDKNAISPEDKARADALVGPQNRDTPAVPAVSAVQDAPVPAPAAPPPPPEPMPRPAAAPPSPPAAQPTPHPQNRPQPTLDDLLD
jgi:hypothetical protein